MMNFHPDLSNRHPRHHRLRHVTMAMDHNFLDRIGLASKVMIKSEKVIMQKWHLNSKGLSQLLGIHPVCTFGRGGTLNFSDPFILLSHNLRHTKPVQKYLLPSYDVHHMAQFRYMNEDNFKFKSEKLSRLLSEAYLSYRLFLRLLAQKALWNSKMDFGWKQTSQVFSSDFYRN